MDEQMTRTKVEVKKPEWAKQFERQWLSGVAHSFILHFNIRDYVGVPGLSFRGYMSRLLNKMLRTREKSIIVFYNRRGLSFAVPTMRDEFLSLVGLAQKVDTGAARSPALAARQKAMQSASVSGGDLPSTPEQVLPLLDKALHQNLVTVAVIIEDADTIFPNADLSFMSPDDRTNLVTAIQWGIDSEIASTGNLVIMTAVNAQDIHANIRDASAKYEAILVDLPAMTEREEFAELLKERNAQDVEWRNKKLAEGGSDERVQPYNWEMTTTEFARATAGLGLIHLEDIALRAAYSGALTRALVKERKDTILAQAYAEVIESMEVREGWEAVGGLEHIKRGFQRTVIDPIKGGDLWRVPKGVLMVGPPGTGKSLVARIVAKEAGFNAVKLNLAKILGMYVGQSERNLELVLTAIKSLAPTIVFMDEVDQSVSRSTSGDANVGSRLFGRLLDFMADPTLRGEVVFLGATNRPDLIDPAFMRPGRFDIIAPFFAPTASERESIFRLMAVNYRVALKKSDDLADLVAQTEKWTGAEIEGLARKAGELIMDEGLAPVEALTEAAFRLFPSTSQIDWFEDLALKYCSDLDWMPQEKRDEYRQRLQNRQELERQIAENAPDDYPYGGRRGRYDF